MTAWTRNATGYALTAILLLATLPCARGAAQAPPTEALTFAPIADTFVESTAPATNFNADALLRTDASPIRIIYLRFAVTGVNGRAVQQARLRLMVSGQSVAGGTIHKITSSSWDEATVTYNTRPAVDGPGLDTLGAVALDAVVEFTLDGTITGDGVYNLAIDTTNSDAVSYVSSAATSGQKPVLLLTVAADPRPSVRIVQPPDGASFFAGDAITLQGTAVDAEDGDLSAAIAWGSSLAGPLGTGPTVTTRTLIEGRHTVTAAVTDRDGLSGSAQVTITIDPPPPVNTEPLVTITAPTNGETVSAGQVITFSGTAHDLESGALTAGLRWTSSRDGALGTGGSFTRALSGGTHQITASVSDSGGLQGAATVTVNVTAPVTLEFTPSADTYADASSPSASFGAAKVLRIDANTERISYVRFAIAGVGARTVKRAILRLQVDSVAGAESDRGGTVHAISNSSWQESTLTYGNRPAVDGPALASTGAVALNQVVELDVTAAVSGDGNRNFAIVNPSSNGADYRSRESATPPKLIVTLGGNAPSVAITAPASQAVFLSGDLITLRATATDVEDGDLTSQLQWTSSLDGALGAGATVSTSTLRIGTHTIAAAATDTSGLAGAAQITLRVRGPNAPPAITIIAPADGATILAGPPVTLTAVATDDFDGPLSDQIRWTSSRLGPLGSGATRTVLLAEGGHTFTATVTDSDGATASAVIALTVTPAPPVVTITAPAAGTTVFADASVGFAGTAIDATDGTLSAGLAWTSDRDGPIGAGPSFATTGLSVGTHVVTAAVADSGGLVGRAQRTVVVRPPNAPPRLAIQAPAGGATLLSGKPVLLSATATDAENGNLGAAVRWTSSRDGALGSGATLTVPALSPGTHTLTASVADADGATASASVAVTLVPSLLTFTPVADTYVNASSPTTKYGTASALTADASPVKQMYFRFAVAGIGALAVEQARLRLTVGSASAASSNSGGSVRAMTDNGWSEATTTYNTRPPVDGPMLATRATAVKKNQVIDFDVTTGVPADGTYSLALVTVSSDDVIYQSRESSKKPQLIVTLKQNTAPVLSITAPASGSNATFGSPVTLAATASDAENGNLSSRVAWSSSLDGALGTGASLTLSTLSPGAHTITARVTDTSGASAEAAITLTIGHPPVIGITSPADGTVFFTSQLPVTFMGSASDVEDGSLSSAIQWTSSRDGGLGTGVSVTPPTLTIGTHVITAAVTDASGITRQATITIRVRGPNVAPNVTIMSPAAGGSTPAGTPVILTATASDDFDGDLSAVLHWSSDVAGALFTGASATRVLPEGTHVLSAQVTDSDGVTGAAQVTFTVSPTAPAVTITAPAPGALIFAGNLVTFTGSASDVTQGDLSAALRWTSDINGPIGTGASFSTSSLSQGTHLVTAAVTDASGLSGQAQRTVLVRPPDVPPVVTISSPANGAAYLGSRSVLLTASALDEEDGNLSHAIRWTSDRDGFLGTGASLNVATLSPGTHLFTAAVTDRDGVSASASVTITMTPSTLVLTPVADTWVDATFPTSNFGGDVLLQVDASPANEAYFRFQVSGMGPFAVDRIVLRLTVGSNSSASSASGGTVHPMTNTTWSESTTTWNTRPVIDGPPLASVGALSVNQVVDFDLTGLHLEGLVSLALVSANSDSVKYRSREETSGKPQLLITFRNPDEPRVTIDTPVNGTVVSFGQLVALSGTASDVQDGDLSAALNWSSSIDGAIGTGPSFTRVLSAGVHTITASVTDTGGNAGTASTTVDVRASNGTGVRDWKFAPSIENGESNEATAQKPESKLWYVDGLWWATLYTPTAVGHHIYKFNRTTNAWLDTGVLVDERPQARQDVLWDGQKLYMASRYAGSPAQARLLRFSYNSASKSWSMDAGFPVDISGGGTLALTIAKDTTGTLWIAYTVGKKVWINHSLGSDTAWGAPALLPFPEGAVKDDGVHSHDIAGVIALPGKIGVFWTNQLVHKDFFATHVDGAPDTAWTLEIAGSGGNFADDHFNMKLAADGRLFVMIKTNNNTSGAILDGLLVRSASGTWSPLYAIALQDFNPTRELILLDEVRRKVYAFYSLGHVAIYYKVSDMDTIAFPDGPGTPFITSTSVNDLNNPMSCKQSITPESGLLVMASSRADSSYWHNIIPLP